MLGNEISLKQLRNIHFNTFYIYVMFSQNFKKNIKDQ